ncbi:hypothetical protein B0H16DRAFT_1846327 [Mycena metata]|uniref:G-protein coupled receptors family 2 profile 2 domain-containing protein n=1 Tax=Mycena metata TaxID=1033252 RepID=A0AAD7K6J8_9AGAR|nr:hypothetical protein B0H16DRAFT_1846327 [Mycena metata]
MSPQTHTLDRFNSHISNLMLAFGVVDIVFISLILVACLWAACNPVSRPHLNRVSFRLLVCALVANLFYGGLLICSMKLGPDPACSGVAFFGNVCLMFAGVMFFCMALNLVLVLVYGVNGQSMEKYYMLGAVAMPLVCTVPPYAAGASGYWAANDACWFNSPDPVVQLRWWIGTQGFWMLLTAAGEVVSFFVIVGFMASSNAQETIFNFSWPYKILRHRVVSAIASGTSSLKPPTLPKPPIVAYRNIILRIGLYPLVSCLFIVTGGFLDFYRTKTQNRRLGIVHLLVYSLRPMAYAILAATDPSFLRALRALRGSQHKATAPIVETKFYASPWRSSASSVTSSPSESCDIEVGLDSSSSEGESTAEESEQRFTCHI